MTTLVTDLVVQANDALRLVLKNALCAAGLLFELDMDLRIARYAEGQARLKRRYRVDDSTPIRPYDEETLRAVETYAATKSDARFAFTSGSTRQPKKIAFTRGRLLKIKLGSMSVATRLYVRNRDVNLGLFILAALKEDDSLSSLILDWEAEVPRLGGLLMPAKYLGHPSVAKLIPVYGATAARLLLLILSNPGVIYSTNPSTLALFLNEVHERWEGSTRLVRELVRQPELFDDGLQQVVRRVASSGWRERLALVAEAKEPVPVERYVPGLATYICWDGGYVRPFLDQIAAFLPPDRFRLVPMYSMSTETVETLTHFDGDEVRFLPVAPGVLYEFIAEGAEDRPENLIAAADLEPGRTYAMVVSDAYGLRRYQTDDLFHCVAKVESAPDLRFLRRRGLSYSFTGEKITDQHVGLAFERLREDFPVLRRHGVQLTCIPSQPDGAKVPEYRVVLAVPGDTALDGIVSEELAAAFDRHLGEANHEFASKIRSGRLGPSRPATLRYDLLASRLDAKTQEPEDIVFRRWDSQFKLLPLYRRLWEELGL
jgi:acyl-CoA synthetase (AMP-forming)/AMP-acid ligase II